MDTGTPSQYVGDLGVHKLKEGKMNRAELNELMSEGAVRRLALTQKKSADYSNEGDALLNFKQLNEMCDILDIKPGFRLADTALYFIVHKLQRLCNLRGRMPSNESIIDTIDDIHNYTDLYLGLLVDSPTTVTFAEATKKEEV